MSPKLSPKCIPRPGPRNCCNILLYIEYLKSTYDIIFWKEKFNNIIIIIIEWQKDLLHDLWNWSLLSSSWIVGNNVNEVRSAIVIVIVKMNIALYCDPGILKTLSQLLKNFRNCCEKWRWWILLRHGWNWRGREISNVVVSGLSLWRWELFKKITSTMRTNKWSKTIIGFHLAVALMAPIIQITIRLLIKRHFTRKKKEEEGEEEMCVYVIDSSDLCGHKERGQKISIATSHLLLWKTSLWPSVDFIERTNNFTSKKNSCSIIKFSLSLSCLESMKKNVLYLDADTTDRLLNGLWFDPSI